jgi:hypothetical protein
MKYYLELARVLLDSNFKIYGMGNFDLDWQDIATLLMLLNNEPEKVKNFYEELEKQRMG